MSTPPSHSDPSSPHTVEKTSHKTTVAEILEMGDGLVHLFVGVLLLLLAVIILANSTYGFVLQLRDASPSSSYAPIVLSYLSELLLGVIILELLSTILTYVKARNLEATIKDFLIVGLISSIRKILLIGAQSSIEPNETAKGAANEAVEHIAKASPDLFIKESIGTVISIVGILLLIGGLLLLDRRKKLSVEAERHEEHHA